jgi:hypothetical protein
MTYLPLLRMFLALTIENGDSNYRVQENFNRTLLMGEKKKLDVGFSDINPYLKGLFSLSE